MFEGRRTWAPCAWHRGRGSAPVSPESLGAQPSLSQLHCEARGLSNRPVWKKLLTSWLTGSRKSLGTRFLQLGLPPTVTPKPSTQASGAFPVVLATPQGWQPSCFQFRCPAVSHEAPGRGHSSRAAQWTDSERSDSESLGRQCAWWVSGHWTRQGPHRLHPLSLQRLQGRRTGSA